MGAIAGGSEKQQLYSTPSAGLLNLGDENVKQLKPIECLGGCLITDLQPRAFWAKLGFSSTHIDNNILFNDATYTAAGAVAKIKYLNSRRVRPNVLMSDYRSSLLPYVGNFGNVATFGAEEPAVGGSAGQKIQQTNADTMMLIATTNTTTLRGDENYVVDSIGYYRIEAETVLSNDYKQSGGRLGSVVGVVSKQYNANDFITAYGSDSSVVYVHAGSSQVISAVNVRVIDPLTNEPVKSLGANSTVFFEIVKAEKKKGK